MSQTRIMVTDKSGHVLHSMGEPGASPRPGTHLHEVRDAEGFRKDHLNDALLRAVRYGDPTTCIENVHGSIYLHSFFPFHGLLSKSENNPFAIVVVSRPMPAHVIRFLNSCGIDLQGFVSVPFDEEGAMSKAPRDSWNGYIMDSGGHTLYSEIRAIPHEPTDGQHYSVWMKTLPDYADAIRGSFESAQMGVSSPYIMIMGTETVLCACFPYYGKLDPATSPVPLLQLALCHTLDGQCREFLMSTGIAI